MCTAHPPCILKLNSRMSRSVLEMDSDELVIIDNDFTPSAVVEPSVPQRLELAKRDIDSEDEPEVDSHPIIHTNMPIRNGKYRCHNYLRDTNDNCAFCHDFLLQAYSERHFGAYPPPPPMMAPVSRCVVSMKI